MPTTSSRRPLAIALSLMAFLLAAQGCTQHGTQDLPLSQPASATLRPTPERSGHPLDREAAQNLFDGEWAVAWCDKSKPELDCGGFNLGLVQNGDRLCGSYDSARVGLSQIDEGGRVSGTASNGSVLLTIESERSGGKYTATASIRGDQLVWKLRDTLREGTRDIDIIAIDEKLDRRPLQDDVAAKHEDLKSECAAQWSSS